jgi:hypothetical protein
MKNDCEDQADFRQRHLAGILDANIDENGGDTPWPQGGGIDILEYAHIY